MVGSLSGADVAFNILTQSQFDSNKKGAVEYTYHSGYDELTFANDIALLNFASAVTSPQVSLSTISDPANFPATLYVAGWGLTEREYLNGDASLSQTLKYAAVPSMTNAECRDRYYGSGLPDTSICAGGVLSDACQGDSGGPLSVQGATDTQVGVVRYDDLSLPREAKGWKAAC